MTDNQLSLHFVIFLKLPIAVCLMTGCNLAAPPFNERNPVRPLLNGDYNYTFKYSDVCLTDEEIKSCAETQLIKRKLLSLQCVNGVEMLFGSGPSNGWAHATFRCAK